MAPELSCFSGAVIVYQSVKVLFGEYTKHSEGAGQGTDPISTYKYEQERDVAPW